MRNSTSEQGLNLTFLPRRKGHQAYPKPKLGNSDSPKPDDDWNVLQGHGIYPVTILQDQFVVAEKPGGFHLAVRTTCARRVQMTNMSMWINAVFSHLFHGNVRTAIISKDRNAVRTSGTQRAPYPPCRQKFYVISGWMRLTLTE